MKQLLILQWKMRLSCAAGSGVSTGSPVGNLTFLMKFFSSGKKKANRFFPE